MIVCPLRTRSAGVKRTRQEGQPVGHSGHSLVGVYRTAMHRLAVVAP